MCSSPNNFGTTPLHWTASKGYSALAELLLKNNADVNYIDAYGKTPLDLAAMHNNDEVADILIKNKGKTHLIDWRGRRALNFAFNSRNFVILFSIKN